ncbi:hypothetical protein GJ496_001364 [Pomphorhynchus laevis]|nr:hypothetical protein GJ496_001364 [Pomphorhynchus laevis]
MLPSFTKFVEPYLFLMVVSITIQAFCLQYLVLDSSCLKIYSEDECYYILNNKSAETIHHENVVQTQAAKWNFIANISYGISSTLFSMMFGIMGNILNDRKKVLLILGGGNLICGFIILLARSVTGALSRLQMAVIYQLLSGVFGGVPLIILMSNDFLSAVVSSTHLTKRFSKAESVLMLSIMVGPLFAGFSLDNTGFFGTTSIPICLIVLAIIYSAVFLQRPTMEPDIHYGQWYHLLPNKIWQHMYSIFKAKRYNNKDKNLRMLLSVNFLGCVSLNGNYILRIE